MRAMRCCSYLFGIAVEEEIDHDVPLRLTVDFAAQTEDFTREEPPHETDGFRGLDSERQRVFSVRRAVVRTLLLHGIAISMKRSDDDGSQKAMTGMLTNEASSTA